MVKDLLSKYNFRFNKALGQNFITDKNLLEAIVSDANIEENDTVVEIGTGAGTLTAALAKKAKRVITFEVDRNLEQILNEALAGFNNIELHFSDVLNMSDDELKAIIKTPFKVVANLPYYITTPLIMRFLESSLEVISLTLMMQKEVALRMTAKSGTADYGAITVGVDACGDTKITRNIPKTMFFPVPKVDSALLHIVIKKDKYGIDDMGSFKKIVKAAFMWRRKTLANNISATYGISKANADKILADNGFDIMIRGERLTTEDFVKLSKVL